MFGLAPRLPGPVPGGVVLFLVVVPHKCQGQCPNNDQAKGQEDAFHGIYGPVPILNDPGDAMQKRVAVAGEADSEAGSLCGGKLFEAHQCVDQSLFVTRAGDGQIVAAMFPLLPDARR